MAASSVAASSDLSVAAALAAGSDPDFIDYSVGYDLSSRCAYRVAVKDKSLNKSWTAFWVPPAVDQDDCDTMVAQWPDGHTHMVAAYTVADWKHDHSTPVKGAGKQKSKGKTNTKAKSSHDAKLEQRSGAACD